MLVQQVLQHDPLSGQLFCFRGRRGDLLKVIWHDGQGACLFTKRLERGRFLWPVASDGAVTISSAQLGYLLSGIDWRHPQETFPEFHTAGLAMIKAQGGIFGWVSASPHLLAAMDSR